MRSSRVWSLSETCSSRTAGLIPSAAHLSLTSSNFESITMKKAYNVGIVGATGAVGQELIRLLEMRDFPFGEIRLLASARSAGKTVEAFGKKLTGHLR